MKKEPSPSQHSWNLRKEDVVFRKNFALSQRISVTWMSSSPSLPTGYKLQFVEDVASVGSRSGSPIKKCPGVRVLMSDVSGDSGVKGFEQRAP
ncbi:hypothetical protein TNCV_4646041 [Trichonephila clavipes]|nr:hypothetical protein TNCV_4646041 [Trichonephila clavipes]